jgi:hypothetical protein
MDIKAGMLGEKRSLVTLVVHTSIGLKSLWSSYRVFTQSDVDGRRKKKLKGMTHELQHQDTCDRSWCLAESCRSQFQDRLNSIMLNSCFHAVGCGWMVKEKKSKDMAHELQHQDTRNRSWCFAESCRSHFQDRLPSVKSSFNYSVDPYKG